MNGVAASGAFSVPKNFFLWKLNRTAKMCRGESNIALGLAATPNYCGSSRGAGQGRYLWRKESAALIHLG